MKKHLYIAAFVAVVLFVTSCNKETEVTTPNNDTTERTTQNTNTTIEAEELGIAIDINEIDSSIEQFVEAYFPQTSITCCHQTNHCYNVKLEDNTMLRFHLDFEWIKVNCKSSTIYDIVPSELVPEPIAAHVIESYPSIPINSIEKKDFGWKIHLHDDTCIKFDTDFNVIGCGNGSGNGGNGGNHHGGGNHCGGHHGH